MNCPRCITIELKATPILRDKMGLTCSRCKGMYINAAVIKANSEPFVQKLFEFEDILKSSLLCPGCQKVLTRKTLPINETTLELDFCRSCSAIWFDAQEMLAVPETSEAGSTQKKANAILYTGAGRTENKGPLGSVNGRHFWKIWLLSAFTIPYLKIIFTGIEMTWFVASCSVLLISGVLRRIYEFMLQDKFFDQNGLLPFQVHQYYLIRALESLAHTRLLMYRQRLYLSPSLRLSSWLFWLLAIIFLCISL